MVRYSFPVRLFHSLLHAGLSRRTLRSSAAHNAGPRSHQCFPVHLEFSRPHASRQPESISVGGGIEPNFAVSARTIRGSSRTRNCHRAASRAEINHSRPILSPAKVKTREFIHLLHLVYEHSFLMRIGDVPHQHVGIRPRKPKAKIVHVGRELRHVEISCLLRRHYE